MKVQDNNIYEADDVNFAGSTTGTEEIDLNGRVMMAILTPASLGAATLTFLAALKKGGPYTAPVRDETGAVITVTISATPTTEGWSDLTKVFPASVQFFKVVSNNVLTGKKIQVISRNV